MAWQAEESKDWAIARREALINEQDLEAGVYLTSEFFSSMLEAPPSIPNLTEEIFGYHYLVVYTSIRLREILLDL